MTRRNPVDLQERRAQVIQHLCGKCGLSEREARSLVGNAKGQASLRPALSEEGLDVYQAAVKREIKSPVLRALLLLLPLTGLRIQEAVSLTWEHVVHDGRPALLVIGKGSKPRRVALTDRAFDLLQRYREEYRPEKDSELWMFPVRGGPNHVDAGRAQRALRFLQRKDPRLAEVTPHVLRHTYASLALARCQDLRKLRENLGHDSKKTTLLYYHVHT